MPVNQAVGIDLGTTISTVAFLSPTGQTSMLRSPEGEMLIPSVVLFDQNKVIVGRQAKDRAATMPDSVAECVKRDIGRDNYSKLIHGEQIPPEVIQACILKYLKANIENVIKDDYEVVITVPAYFDEPRRKATADAGTMAGFKVMDLINEPTAAALSFGEHLGYLTASGEMRQKLNVLVYDLGGGTFDVTVLQLKPGDLRTLATDGDVQLGGRDWDQALVDLAAEQYLRNFGVDPRDNPTSLTLLFRAAEQAKHNLSVRSKTKIEVVHEGQRMDVPITREQFVETGEVLLERTAYTTRQVLGASGLSWDDIDRVLMVGGSTRMPMVAQMLEELSGITPDHSVNPDEAVARGAAIYAGYLITLKKEKKTAPGQATTQAAAGKSSFRVTDVNSHSLGIEGVNQDTGRKENVILIPRNTPLPVRTDNRFATKVAGQRSVAVKVLEGESSEPAACILIGSAAMRNLPPELPKGHPIRVAYQYDRNGRLAIAADIPGSKSRVSIELERPGGLSKMKVSRWREVVASDGGFDEFEAMVQDTLRSDSMIANPNAPIPIKQPEATPSQNTPAPEPAPIQRPTPPQHTPLQQTPPHNTPIPVAPTPVAPAPPAQTPTPVNPSGNVAPASDISPPPTGNGISQKPSAGSGKKLNLVIFVVGNILAGIIGLGFAYWFLHTLGYM